MPAYVADLHNHTPHLATDYRGPADTSPDDVVRAAATAGIDILGATDHFCADYVDQLGDAASRFAEETGREMLVLGGAELKIAYGADEVHLVTLFEPSQACGTLRDVMGEFGLACPVAADDELPGVVIDVDPVSLANRVREAGGIAIAGHVDRLFGDYRLTDSSYFLDLVYCDCFDAIEVTEKATWEWLQRVTTPAIISSSDAHAPSEIGRRRTLIAAENLSFDSLKQALRRGSSVPLIDASVMSVRS
jgi:PHP family Zn ribbon phosphoesterase